MNLLKGKSEKIRLILESLAEETIAYQAVLEEAKLRHPHTNLECDYHIALSNHQEQIYNSKYSAFLFTHLEYFSKFKSSSKTSSVTQSRDPSPTHKGAIYRHLKHLCPKELPADCDPRQYTKFQRDYTAWMVNSFIGKQKPDDTLYYDMMVSRLNSTWQSRIRHMQGNSTKKRAFGGNWTDIC